MNAIEVLLKEYRSEVEEAAFSFYAWKFINDLATNDSAVFEALDANAFSWKLITRSLLINFFSTLGRLFDRDERSLTARTFISKCKAELGQFSNAALEARKLANNHGKRPDELDNYLLSVYEPVAADFQKLADAIKPLEVAYIKNYRDIRHKLVAHKDFATISDGKDSLFENTNIGEIETILEGLYHVLAVIQQLYDNGKQTNLVDYKLRDEEYLRKELESLLRKVAT